MQLEEPIASSSSSITAGRFSIPWTISLTWRSNVGRWSMISLLDSQYPAWYRKYVVMIGIEPGSAVRLWQKIF